MSSRIVTGGAIELRVVVELAGSSGFQIIGKLRDDQAIKYCPTATHWALEFAG